MSRPGGCPVRHRFAFRWRLLSLLVVACTTVSPSLAGADDLPVLAVADFDFRDTSGEVRDQTREHEARLEAFMVTLRGGFSADHKVKPMKLPCQAERCSARDSGLETIAAQAKAADARYLLIGQIHKMSTLVGWAKYAVIDLGKNKPVCDRFLTYRGDTDEAWQRAAKFSVQDIEKYCFP